MAKYVITAIGEEVARVYKGTDAQPGVPEMHTHIPYVDNNLVPLGLFKWDNVNMVYNETVLGGRVMELLMYFDEFSFGGAIDSFALKANYRD